ncbi:MAG TPA: hypothetical protein VGC91_04930 [Pyrinomonadaceae bacterium]|jgi:hypothetical protein
MKALTLIVLLCGALFFIGCSKSDNANTANGNNSNNSNAKPGATKAGTSGDSIGVAACDEYFAKIDKCLNSPNVPDVVKTTFKQSREQNRKAWEQAASTPQGKAQLETSCKTALEQSQTLFATCK